MAEAINNYRNIGKLIAAFGLKGEMVLHHHLGKKTSLKGLEVIFIQEQKSEMLPYFIESSKLKTDQEVFLKLEGINDKESARKFIQREVWLTESDFHKYASKSAPISLVGYKVVDQGRDLGEIIEVIEQPHQVLCKLTIDQKEVLLPLNEKTLQKTDPKNKIVFVNLPEGLLDIYLD